MQQQSGASIKPVRLAMKPNCIRIVNDTIPVRLAMQNNHSGKQKSTNIHKAVIATD